MCRLQSCSRIFEKSSAVAEKKIPENRKKCAHYPAIDFAWTAALQPVYIQCIAVFNYGISCWIVSIKFVCMYVCLSVCPSEYLNN